MILTCGCHQQAARQPHVALALRATAMDAMPRLWEAVTDFLAAKACAMHYVSGRVLALVPEMASGHWETWYRHLTGAAGPVSGGVSAAYIGCAGLSFAQDEALSALNLGERLHGPGHLTAYGDVFLLDYATSLVENGRLRQIYETVISKLAIIDQPDRIELLTTLDMFLATGCSTQATAEPLGLHRNTVQLRLRRIIELTEFDLNDLEVRFLIQLALRAHKHLSNKSTPAPLSDSANSNDLLPPANADILSNT
jgi:sugar diacid utilization regulator